MYGDVMGRAAPSTAAAADRETRLKAFRKSSSTTAWSGCEAM